MVILYLITQAVCASLFENKL